MKASNEIYDKKFLLRTSVKLYSKLKKKAAEQKVSLNVFINNLLESKESSYSFRNLLSEVEFNQIRLDLSDEIMGCVLFGSTARGDSWSNSDQDIIFIVKPQGQICRSWYRWWDGKNYPQVLSPIFVNLPDSFKEPSILFLEMAIDGIVLFDTNDNDIKNYLQHLRMLVASGLFTRKQLHGQPVWSNNEKSNSNI